MARSEGEKRLTDTALQALKPGVAYEVRDKVTPGLVVRVTPKGTRSFMLKARFGGSKNPTRRLLGTYDPHALPEATAGAITLETARRKARQWMAVVKTGRDPAKEEAAKAAGAFAAVAEDYIKKAVIGPDPDNPRHRQWVQTSRDIRKVFIPRWGGKHLTDIKRADIVAFIKEHGERAPGHTRNFYITLHGIFGWARDQHEYGLEHSPCEGIKVSALLGSKPNRKRVLSDDELRAMWVNTRMGYPFGSILKLLMLTGLRKNEVAQATWSEIQPCGAAMDHPRSAHERPQRSGPGPSGALDRRYPKRAAIVRSDIMKARSCSPSPTERSRSGSKASSKSAWIAA